MIRPSLLPGALAAGAVVALLVVVAWLVPVSYVALAPGPTADTLGEWEGEKLVTVTPSTSEESDGELLMTTVLVLEHLNLADAVIGWLDPTEAVVPEESIFPSDRTREEYDQINEELFTDSEDAATTAALTYLGYPTEVRVVNVTEGGPSDGRLKADDVITAVDGTAVSTTTDLISVVGATDPGTTLTVEYTRDGAAASVALVTEQPESGPHRSVIGVLVATEPTADVDVDIQAEGIGGPSAGLMLALSIVDQLTPGDLTGGQVIAGTGEISPEGEVGAIGGVRQKVIAAGDEGAGVFLLPPPNCRDAVKTVPEGVRLVPVTSLEGAVDALTSLADGDEAADLPSCTPGSSD